MTYEGERRETVARANNFKKIISKRDAGGRGGGGWAAEEGIPCGSSTGTVGEFGASACVAAENTSPQLCDRVKTRDASTPRRLAGMKAGTLGKRRVVVSRAARQLRVIRKPCRNARCGV